MYRVCQQDLPFRGLSHNFVGADNGDVNISVFLVPLERSILGMTRSARSDRAH
jgi:hypothetical protein